MINISKYILACVKHSRKFESYLCMHHMKSIFIISVTKVKQLSSACFHCKEITTLICRILKIPNSKHLWSKSHPWHIQTCKSDDHDHQCESLIVYILLSTFQIVHMVLTVNKPNVRRFIAWIAWIVSWLKPLIYNILYNQNSHCLI